MTQEELKRLVRYDPETGAMTWKVCLSKRAPEGRSVGSSGGSGGLYLRACIKGRRYYVHQLAWLYMHGSLPQMLDHIDGNPRNNQIGNLRPCNKQQNGANRTHQARNPLALKGVTKTPSGRYIAYIRPGGRRIHLGTFDDPLTAHAAYLAAAKEHFGAFARD